MSELKERPVIAAFYACYFREMIKTAREHGYALAVHGSMINDLDLVCLPWVEKVSPPDVLVEAFIHKHGLERINAVRDGVNVAGGPHGRRSYCLSMGGPFYIDLSVWDPSNAAI